MANERKTEKLTREILNTLNYKEKHFSFFIFYLGARKKY